MPGDTLQATAILPGPYNNETECISFSLEETVKLDTVCDFTEFKYLS